MRYFIPQVLPLVPLRLEIAISKCGLEKLVVIGLKVGFQRFESLDRFGKLRNAGFNVLSGQEAGRLLENELAQLVEVDQEGAVIDQLPNTTSFFLRIFALSSISFEAFSFHQVPPK